MYPRRSYEQVCQLVRAGLNDSQIWRQTGISRCTVRQWRLHGPPGISQSSSAADCPTCGEARINEPSYAYLLGLYLGDGSISKHPRALRLRIYLDARYPMIIDEAARAVASIRRIRPGKVGIVPERGCVAVSAYWQHWACVFPQHGPGVKHSRAIFLAPWQGQIVTRQPERLLRGLIHSDGCRSVNRVWNGKYAYPRYFFTNHSRGIRQIFTDTCELLGISYRYSNPVTISIARRSDVAALDAFIGPKR